MFLDSKSRSLVKAFSWRMMAFVILGAISYMFTGDWQETTLITVVYNLIQIGTYFAHERAWDKVEWGRVPQPGALKNLPPVETLDPEDVIVIREHLKSLGYFE